MEHFQPVVGSDHTKRKCASKVDMVGVRPIGI